MFLFPCKALGVEGSCCQSGVNLPAEVIDPQAKPIPPPFEAGEATGDLALEMVHSDNSGRLAPIEEEEEPSSPLSAKSGLQRMRELRHMEVDAEVTRGIPLHVALQRSELWTSPNEIRRRNRSAEVWNLSTKVKSLDIFLSHTWQTKGRWKILALTMQTGWLHGLLAWFVGVATMLFLRGFGIVDDPWKNARVATTGKGVFISLTPWTVIASQLSLVIGLFFSPYIPFRTRMCFFDVACIHQGDANMFERGIYNIGGCLSVAKELRVLYTPKYLSSLWCVFELVSFRKAKPKGKLIFFPLFMERSATICALIMWCIPLGLNFVLGVADDRFRQTNAIVVIVLIYLLPMIFIVYTLRYNYREKRRLILDWKAFNVDNLHCASDVDRSFILSAIESWYGSKEAFNKFVQGDLRAELLGLLPSPHLPGSYAALIFSGQLTWSLDFCLSMSKADGVRFIELPPYFLSQVSVGTCWVWFALNATFYLSDRSAGYGGTCFFDFIKTLVVVAGPFSFILIGYALWFEVIRSNSRVGLVCYVAFSMLLPLIMLDACKVCRRRCQ